MINRKDNVYKGVKHRRERKYGFVLKWNLFRPKQIHPNVLLAA